MSDLRQQLQRLVKLGAALQHDRAYTHGPSDGHLAQNGIGNSRFPECPHPDCVFARSAELDALVRAATSPVTAAAVISSPAHPEQANPTVAGSRVVPSGADSGQSLPEDIRDVVRMLYGSPTANMHRSEFPRWLSNTIQALTEESNRRAAAVRGVRAASPPAPPNPEDDYRGCENLAGSLTLRHLQHVNAKRAARWHKGGLTDWSALEWAGAMAGEAGEACNAAKKLKRIEDGIANII